jgi:cytochrome c-type biogenesis protein CcmH/NrfG
VYNWRRMHAKSTEEKEQMTKAADLAFRQAFALCPSSPEAVFCYANLLITSNHFDDAILIASTCLKVNPENNQIVELRNELQKLAAKK